MQPDAEGQEGCWQTHGEMLPTTECSGYAILDASLYISILMFFLLQTGINAKSSINYLSEIQAYNEHPGTYHIWSKGDR